ncbi:ImmA/IrrE family metallo-endopeptidase [Mesorhizobium sp. B3-1-3]|uniref:ImmA/IrrE family metallo-endopeptidase n=1 Tax=unclassified Mesorhizobium TaxID=325217 RepID=UPI00112D8283|nr:MULTISPECIES: ImmA/IrrE family metallo-endopeptidase [unclassified Mesorhizobium]TPI68137.1 ImmA/IrrE family metallo-endopeptidase [Mesorhizobium sp. B3-1-8]TPI73418.1 ImmA/IrrE family metallo-endopeptidase [Mesorhizobium sp. B3-1-3]
MSHDYYVPAKSRIDVEQSAAAWRQALGVSMDCQAPDMVGLLENEIPKLFGHFALLVKPDSAMKGAEGYTEFAPPKIVLSESTYIDASNYGGRGRWTAAHELGHLVQHEAAVPMERAPVKYSKMKELPAFASAEWQANAFAAAFLMPQWLIRDFKNISEVVDFFSVSRKAAEIRLDQLKISEKRIIVPEIRSTIDTFKDGKH